MKSSRRQNSLLEVGETRTFGSILWVYWEAGKTTNSVLGTALSTNVDQELF